MLSSRLAGANVRADALNRQTFLKFFFIFFDFFLKQQKSG
jgi:hypothetical protein